MTAVAVELEPFRPAPAPDEIVVVEDLDQVVEVAMCSCQAGDDQPY
ncbi:hypothetical protein [Streptomyces xantholiticus]|uniref:Uncharacterized protein n=1 Tax=Streptomyces xantholiticus TaxID=68285 RepID=A0ABV1UZS4_9ACTN